MSRIVEFMSQNPYLMVLSLILTPVAFVMGIYQAKRKQIGFLYKMILLVDNSLSKVEGLDILFQGKPIDSLAVTHVKFFNSGNTIIERDDVYKNHEIRIGFDNSDISISSSRVVYQSSDTINATVSISDGSAVVSFDTLEKRDSLIISIYHNHSTNPKPQVSGKIKEGKIIDFSVKAALAEKAIQERAVLTLCMMSAGFAILSVLSFFGIYIDPNSPFPHFITIITIIITLVTFWFVNRNKEYNNWKYI